MGPGVTIPDNLRVGIAGSPIHATRSVFAALSGLLNGLAHKIFTARSPDFSGPAICFYSWLSRLLYINLFNNTFKGHKKAEKGFLCTFRGGKGMKKCKDA